MINLHLRDDEYHLHLTGFYLPSQAVFSAQPQVEGQDGAPSWQRVPDDEGMARILTALAGQLAGFRLERSGVADPPSQFGLETWLLRSAPENGGRLRDWFAAEPPQTRCRVAIHRTPRRYAGCALPLLWDEAYEDFDAKGPKLRLAEPDSVEAYEVALAVLKEGLAAYRAGPLSVLELVNSLGHPYVHAG